MTNLLPLEKLLIQQLNQNPNRVYSSGIREIAQEHERTRESTVDGARKDFGGFGSKGRVFGLLFGGLSEEQKYLFNDKFPEFQRTFTSPKGLDIVYRAWESSFEANDVSVYSYEGKNLAEEVQVRTPEGGELVSLEAYQNRNPNYKTVPLGGWFVVVTGKLSAGVMAGKRILRFPIVTDPMFNALKEAYGQAYSPQLVTETVKKFCF